jgi:Kef-type K+ transport system membrane component KefB
MSVFKSSMQGFEIRKAARQISVILSGRGAVGIIIVFVALNYGLNDQADSLVIMATTVISIAAPILLGRQMKPQASKSNGYQQSQPWVNSSEGSEEIIRRLASFEHDK